MRKRSLFGREKAWSWWIDARGRVLRIEIVGTQEFSIGKLLKNAPVRLSKSTMNRTRYVTANLVPIRNFEMTPPAANPLAWVMGFHYHPRMGMVLEAEANLTAQNQITIPAPIRKALKLQGGQSRVKFQVRPEDGRVVILRVEATNEQEDPALKPFLALLEKDMRLHPHRLSQFPAPLLDRARSLVAGVEVNLDGPLTGGD